MRYAFFALALLVSCEREIPQTKCEGMEDLKLLHGRPEKTEEGKKDPLFGEKPQEGCQAPQ